MGRKRNSPSTACAACLVSAKAAILPGEVGWPAAANATTWCCWRMSGRPSPDRTAPEVPLVKLARWRKTASRTRDLVRLLGSAALPAHFCPFIGSAGYWQLSSRRNAAMLRNGRLMVHSLMETLGGAAVRRYPHGMFAALVPPSFWSETEAAGEAEQLAADRAGGGLPVRHAGSFGFDFVAVEGFFDTGANQHLLRVAMADLPLSICARVTDGIADWWGRRWRIRAA